MNFGSLRQAGEFTFTGKLKSALWDNMIYYTSYVLIAIILFIYIAMKPDLHLGKLFKKIPLDFVRDRFFEFRN